jgi:hypothetical protein
LLSHRSQAVHRQAIAPFIAEPSVAEPFIAVAVEPSTTVPSLRRRRVADEPSIAVASPSSRP